TAAGLLEGARRGAPDAARAWAGGGVPRAIELLEHPHEKLQHQGLPLPERVLGHRSSDSTTSSRCETCALVESPAAADSPWPATPAVISTTCGVIIVVVKISRPLALKIAPKEAICRSLGVRQPLRRRPFIAQRMVFQTRRPV